MKILRLTAENVKRISIVEVALDESKNLVIVAGKNGQGKSSVLDSIMYAMGGADVLPSKPVRRGQEKGFVELDLGELVAKRTFTREGGGTLTVRKKDGSKLASPQQILDELYGQLAFDPLEFAGMKPQQRSETLRALLKLDFSKEDAERQRAFDERTGHNRDIKRLEAQMAPLTLHANVPEQEVSAAGVFEELKAAQDVNNRNEARRKHRDGVKRDLHNAGLTLAAAERTVNELEQKLKEAKGELALSKHKKEEYEKVFEPLSKEVDGLKDIDLEPFRKKANECDAVNVKVRENKKRKELAAQLREVTKLADACTTKINETENAKRETLANAKFPVKGLGLSDIGEVTFNGEPFDQASTAEQIRCSVAMGLALSKKLPVLLVRSGNDLDDDNLALLAEMAKEANAQIWLERVSTDGDVAVVMEDGHVKAVTDEERGIDKKADAEEREAKGELL